MPASSRIIDYCRLKIYRDNSYGKCPEVVNREWRTFLHYVIIFLDAVELDNNHSITFIFTISVLIGHVNVITCCEGR